MIMKSQPKQPSIPPQGEGVERTSTTNPPAENRWRQRLLSGFFLHNRSSQEQIIKSQQIAVNGTNNDLQSSLNKYSLMIEINNQNKKRRGDQMKRILLTLSIVLLLALMAVNDLAQAETIPTISIVGVTQDVKVTVQTHNYPANRDFDVRMGKIGTRGVGGILVGTFNSGPGGSHRFTFDIPPALNGSNKIAIRLDSKTGGYYSYNWFYNANFGNHTDGTVIEGGRDTPVIMVVTVKKDTLVTIEGSGFPNDETFDVLMGKYSTQGMDGIKVDTLTPETDGTILESFDIPASLESESRIAIRVESTTSDKIAHTWFLNETGAAGGAGTIPSSPGYTGIPTIAILSVDEDESVTIKTHNFPANQDFKVLMGQMGTRGIGGIHVTTIASGTGGSFTETFEIPDELKGNYRIAIRLQTSDGVFYAYNWFYNNTTAVQPLPGYAGIPTFSITAVVSDDTVTIKTNNFPANFDFKVLMGKMGTRGIGGTLVTSVNSGIGGSFVSTFDIPAALSGEHQIAIRLESTTGGFYAYNWFYNNTYP
jgi:hypothetical protein